MEIRRIALVRRKSMYQIYVRERQEPAIAKALRAGDKIAQRMLHSDQTQRAALDHVRETLHRFDIDATEYWRGAITSLRTVDLVIALGGDGTVLDAASKIINGTTPLLGINDDPERSVGALCAGRPAELDSILRQLMSGTLAPKRVNRLHVTLEGKSILGPCLNDILFAHPCPAEMTRCELKTTVSPLKKIPFRCSGIWVCTATGSTGASHSAGLKPQPPLSQKLFYHIREPYLSRGAASQKLRQKAFAVAGSLPPDGTLEITSRSRRAKIWGDGAHRACTVQYGQVLQIARHPSPLNLIRRNHP